MLHIPALWFHATKALDFSVSINSFFKSLDASCYAKDLYGNRDPVQVEQAAKLIKKATEQLNHLPLRYRAFYTRKLGLNCEVNNNTNWK